jgi:hypothetical protein
MSQKSIHPQSLNVLEAIDLNAARLSKPPEVSKAKPLSKDNKPKKINKTTKPTQKNIKQIHLEDSPMMDESSQPVILTQPFAPTISHQKLNSNRTTPRAFVPLSNRISYDVNDILNRKADIDVKDLLIAEPTLKRDLIRAIREKTAKTNNKLTLNYFEDDDIDTTAIYTTFFINDIKIRSMLDTGSAKTCMSKKVADKLGLIIDAPSTSVFTLGNGTKQSSLGLIYDVPLSIGGKLVIPGAVEVLPICPANLIIGNNWMKRAKAKLNLEEHVVKVEYKGIKAQNEFIYTRTHEIEKINKVHNVKFYNTSNKADSTIDFSSPQSDDSDDESEENISEHEDLEPDSSEDSEDDMLMMLEDNYNETEPDYFEGKSPEPRHVYFIN